MYFLKSLSLFHVRYPASLVSKKIYLDGITLFISFIVLHLVQPDVCVKFVQIFSESLIHGDNLCLIFKDHLLFEIFRVSGIYCICLNI